MVSINFILFYIGEGMKVPIPVEVKSGLSNM